MAFTIIMILALPLAARPFVMNLEPRRTVLRVGDAQALRCSARDCAGSATFTWTSLEDKPLFARTESPSPSVSLLVMDPVTTEHENVVVCKVTCGNQMKQMFTAVKVYSFPRAPVVSGNERMQAGEAGALTCVVSDVYPSEYLEIDWLQGETVLHTEEGKTDVSAVSSTYKRTPQPEDNGKEITCRARHGFEGMPEEQKTKETTVSLNVMYAPRDIKISEAAVVMMGMSFTLTCSAEGNPSPVTVWRRRGPAGRSVTVGEGETLTVHNVTMSHTGAYECETSNSVGSVRATVNISVQTPPRNTSIAVSPSSELKEGDGVTISCHTDSVPAALLVLRRVSEGQQTELQSSPDSTSSSLTLSSVQLADSGLYQCEAVNQHGSQAASVQLIVKAPPRNTTVQVLPSSQVQEGQNVTICCRTVSFPPPAVTLTKLGRGVELHSPDGTFVLLNLTPNDTGLYQVNVTNDLGFQTEVFTISVMERQSSPPPSWNNFIFSITGLGAVAIMGTTAGLVIHHLNQARKRGVYELAKSTQQPI